MRHVPLWIVVALALAACAKPPDPDREPAGAKPLPLESWLADGLDCKHGDCADWWRLELAGPGRLTVEAVGQSREASAPPLLLRVADADGTPLAEAQSGPGPVASASLAARRGGSYLVAVLEAEGQGAAPYQLRASFTPAPPPPPPPPPRKVEPPAAPPPERVSGGVVEVERQGGVVASVLIDLGSERGMRPGLHGWLVERGQRIGEVEIVDVYREGSRARIDGSLAAPITPQTGVEIELPARGR